VNQTGKLVVSATTGATRQERIEAYGRLVEQFRDMACGYAYSILADFALAEDAAQEAFIIAFEQLSQLQKPEAFCGWLRRIVWSSCGRLTRHKALPTTTLEAAAEVPAHNEEPLVTLEQKEMRDEVLRAIRELSPDHREVTTLFYINGYSQKDIADFLEVPVSTIKNRLAASRGRLKERMLNMVKDTLRENAPGKRFDKKVIDELLSRPKPLEIEGHPVRQLYETLRGALPSYEVIEGEEVVDKKGIVNPWTLQFAILTHKDRMLRTETSVITFGAMVGRTPPVRLITAGRAFRNDAEDSTHLKVFHQFDLVCVERGADETSMKAALQALLQAVLGQVKLRYEETSLPALAPCYKVEAYYGDAWRGVAGCGVFKPEFLRQTGHDPAAVGGYAFGMGLENLAMLKYGIDDVRKLWQPPYVSG
jgi:RNA polymerase sigma factor (sigma-70 family)